MVQLGSFMLRTNSISNEVGAASEGHAVGGHDNDVGSINQGRSDFTFKGVPILDIVGSAAFEKHPTMNLRLEQMTTTYTTVNLVRENQLYNVFISGHGPSRHEWGSGTGLSNVKFLVAKKDPLTGDVQSADDKSMAPVDQICKMRPVHDIRLRYLSTFSGAPMPLVQAGVSFPHTQWIFTIHSVD
ncbi:hypothetical protein B484DRAFT_411630 [Ochromonadaceae sp. CCMP2298]|nr:hypothetical protein B484DRAFT_411630 [Ochromonadaceae sp. CCMP2298]